MKSDNFEFFIKKFSFNISNDLKFLPMLVSRKLSKLDKIAFSTLYDCHIASLNPNLVFASIHGQYDRLVKLTSQYQEDNEVSPNAFSSSVHNNTIGVFSILNKITAPYISISAGDNTVSAALCEAVIQLKQVDNVLFCYADCFEDKKRSISVLFSKYMSDNSFKVTFSKVKNETSCDEYDMLLNFLQGNIKSFSARYFRIERVL